METTEENDYKYSSNPIKEMLWEEYHKLNTTSVWRSY